MRRYWQKLLNWVRFHKKQVYIGSAIFLSLLLIFLIFVAINKKDTVVDRTEVEQVEKKSSSLVRSPLTGNLVKPSLAERPVTAIVIENSPDSRPQSGLSSAGVVFEAIAEGGITRYIALYQEARPSLIGPVRSLRPYFNDWVMAFDASIVYVGGSAVALHEARNKFKLKDLDQFFHPQTYWRATDRFAPHNVYTNFKRLDKLNQQKKYTKSEFEPLERKKPNPLKKPKAGTINLTISSDLYNVRYVYDKKSNSYKRFLGGEKHINRESKKQIAPDVVVALKISNRAKSNGRWYYDLVGSGVAMVFQDGGWKKGTWKRSGRDKQIELVKGSKTIKLNYGRVWFTAVSPDSKIKYSK